MLNKEAPNKEEEDNLSKEISVTAQQSLVMTLTKPVRYSDQDKCVQIKQEEAEDNIHKISGMINKQYQSEDKKKIIKKKVKLTAQKKKIIRTKVVSDSENNFIMHSFNHPESPLQEESDDNGERIDSNHPIPDYSIEQNIMATIATSIVELSPIQTNTAATTTTTTSTNSTPDFLVKDQTSNVDDHNDIDEEFDDDEDEEKERSDNDEKSATTHNHLNHHYHNHHLNNHQHRLRQTSIGLEQRKHDMKITDAQLDRLSSLIKIIRNGNYNEFLEALESRGFKNLLNIFIDGQTALHYSLIYGRSLAWCKQLVLNGANPNLTNRAGWHPIHLAAFNGSRETMRYLIDCIAN